MCESFLLDPEWIHDFNRVYTDFFKMHFKLLFDEAGVPDAVWLYEDLGYKKGLFCSPRLLKELIFPYYREIIEFFHAYGLFVVLHSCGSTTEALPMITEVGFDGLHPMERAAGNDPLQFAEQYGDRIAFFGGLDKRLVETHDKALIRKEATALIEGMKARGARYIFASDHSISPNTDYDDYRYMLDVYREHMAY
jgi:uroporphyrinogen-III decarboxylase